MSQKIGQKEAVVKAVREVLRSQFSSGVNVIAIITRDQKNQIRTKIFNAIVEGYVTYSKDISDNKELRKYVNGMVDNHIRKAKELNGGIKYTTKNPGSGRGRRDPQLVNLKKLQTKYSQKEPEFTKIQVAIQKRETELAEQRVVATLERKNKTRLKNINKEVLPPELGYLVE